MTELLDVRGLTVSFDDRAVARGIDLQLAAGDCLALVGESGSGKSVTARALVGLAGPRATVTAERLQVGGEDVSRYGERQWRRIRGSRIGFVLQDALTALDQLRTVGAEVDEPLRLHTRLGRTARDAEVERLLAECGIPDPERRKVQYAHELSGGLRQRALIASALAAGPALLIADEPTTALDVTVQQQILDLLAKLKRDGHGLLLISHDLAVVAEIADRIAVLDRGRIVEQGPALDVLRRPQHEMTRELLAAIPGNGNAKQRRVHSGGPAVLSVRGVSHRFRERSGQHRQALAEVGFELARGETLGIVGESGSGKSTLAKVILGLLRPDSGDVLLDGEPWSSIAERNRRCRRRDMQFVPQNPLGALDPRDRVGSVLSESLAATGVPRSDRRQRITALLAEVGLPAELAVRRPSELSGGQRQRVCIARALATEPRILVCDEPVSALDVRTQATVLDLLADLRDRRGLALVFISHDLAVVREISDRVIIMKDGHVVESGAVDEVFDHPEHPYAKELVAATPRIPALETR
jgi:peptide/nickel transport system ATP-binding protein